MPIDYDAIRTENERKYGTDIKRIGGMLLADRYDDLTHFIFEVLQNAEDALAKRGASWNGSRTVKFSLSSDALTISHFGKPFDEADIRGVCGIGESTKDLTDIGRFGIGFKSVYAFTDAPEVHSAGEHFAIHNYVHPQQVAARNSTPEETVIYIPFKEDEPDAKDKILASLRNLNTQTLLFLRQIDQIQWSDDDGDSGLYKRSNRETINSITSKVKLIGQDDSEEEYIVFSREVFNNEGVGVGHVEIAFNLANEDGYNAEQSVQPVKNSPLVVFFPTVLITGMGFIMQGPYRTTPSRDNVPEYDDWNRYLVRETAILLTKALGELRELGMLSISVLECLPLEVPENRYRPLFNQVRDTLASQKLLPAHGGGYISGKNAKLARSRELCNLVSPAQLTRLFTARESLHWLSDEITANRTRQLHKYLTDMLGVGEIAPLGLIQKLTKAFLEEQTDQWTERLYEFLNGRQGINKFSMRNVPLVRLDDGAHTVALIDGQPQAYLPTENETDFPTVHNNVCQSDEAIEFLKFMGIREPDLVDDIIENVLPRYISTHVRVSNSKYQSDIKRILDAYKTDSREQRDRLLSELRKARFLAATDSNGATQFVQPTQAYQATDALKNLFAEVPGVLFVDNSRDYLRGERIRDLLRAVGTPEYLVRVKTDPSLSSEEKRELRLECGSADITREVGTEDYTLMGLDALLAALLTLSADDVSARAKMLWDALRNFEQRNRGNWAFRGTYRWFYYSNRQAQFPAHFVRTLNSRAWVPDKDGSLHPPGDVIFDDTGWSENPILESGIKFMPGGVKELARQFGMEPEAISLLKQHGITSAEQVRERLGINVDAPSADSSNAVLSSHEADSAHGDAADNKSVNGVETFAPNQTSDTAVPRENRHRPIRDSQAKSEYRPASTPGPQNNTNVRENFVSYVAVNQSQDDEEANGLSHQERLSLESQAIGFILSEEPNLRKTPPNNPGFDLFELDAQNVPMRWVEVKSMKGAFDNRPVTLTSTQFEFAQEKQNAYWLYVVENAGNPDLARIIRIRNPAGKARNFTFDKGWREAAEESQPKV